MLFLPSLHLSFRHIDPFSTTLLSVCTGIVYNQNQNQYRLRWLLGLYDHSKLSLGSGHLWGFASCTSEAVRKLVELSLFGRFPVRGNKNSDRGRFDPIRCDQKLSASWSVPVSRGSGCPSLGVPGQRVTTNNRNPMCVGLPEQAKALTRARMLECSPSTNG